MAVGLAATGAAHAGLYKCAVGDGRVFYQDVPCAPGRELRDFDRDPANGSVVPFGGGPARPAGKANAPRGADKSPPATRGAARGDARARKAAGDPRQRRFLRPGMSEGEVLARVGPPDVKASVRKGARWTYMPVAEDAHTITTLTFEGGALADVDRKVIR
jgi:hypothetical protein